jgi:hypothetical protein
VVAAFFARDGDMAPAVYPLKPLTAIFMVAQLPVSWNAHSRLPLNGHASVTLPTSRLTSSTVGACARAHGRGRRVCGHLLHRRVSTSGRKLPSVVTSYQSGCVVTRYYPDGAAETMVGSRVGVEAHPTGAFGYEDGPRDTLRCVEAADNLAPARHERVGRRHRARLAEEPAGVHVTSSARAPRTVLQSTASIA